MNRAIAAIFLALLVLPFVSAGDAQIEDYQCDKARIEDIGMTYGRANYLETGYTYEYDGAEWFAYNQAANDDSYGLNVRITGDEQTVSYKSDKIVDAFVTYEVGDTPEIFTHWYPGGKSGEFQTQHTKIVTVFACHNRSAVHEEPPTEVPEFGGLVVMAVLGIIGTALVMRKRTK